MREDWRAVAVLAAVAALTSADLASNRDGTRTDDWLSWLVLALSLAGLIAFRHRPLAAAAVTGAGYVTWTLYGHVGELLNLPVMLALYGVAVRGDRRRTLLVGAVAALASGAVAVVSGQEEGLPLPPSPVLEMTWPLIPLLVGEVVRGRRELTAHYAERARRAERERELETARRVREERTRIARELHDIVAHTVSAMTVQAGVAMEALERRPELARNALSQVRASGREAVRELHATVAVLREPDAGEAVPGQPPPGPAPGLGQLEELAGRLAGDGLRVTVRVEPPDGLSPLVELTAYRVVQEALTNVLRHSAARHAAVSVRPAGGALTVEVVDDGPARDGAPGDATGGATGGATGDGTPASGSGSGSGSGGYGLLGMRERAAAAGGRVEHGRTAGGGFRVRATLPLGGAEAAPSPAGHGRDDA